MNNGKRVPISTVGRNRKKDNSIIDGNIRSYRTEKANIFLSDSLQMYDSCPSPQVIISDGAYGILGFEGDTSNHGYLCSWYEKHIQKWSMAATAATTLWFWNTEIGWASVHPLLQKYGWKFVSCNIWNKGIKHIAGNINTKTIRRFPVVTEICAHYVFEAKVNELPLKEWLYSEWKRTGLPLRKANEACQVKDVATRKYLDQGHLWYYPPVEMFAKMRDYASEHGCQSGKPYFSLDGITPITDEQWRRMRTFFECPHGYTNVWDRPPLKGKERIKVPKSSTLAAHLNQKPLDLMELIIRASSSEGDVIWEPFGGLFSGSIAAIKLNRIAYSCEIDPYYFNLGIQRVREETTAIQATCL